MNRARCVVLMVALLSIGTVTAAAMSPPEKPTIQIVKFPTPDQQVAWISYGAALALQAKADGLPPGHGVWEPTFGAEVRARESQVAVWKEISAKQPVDYPFMTKMVRIMDAGFMREYVWENYRQLDWVEPKDLRLKEYEAWASTNLVGLKPITGARIVY